MFKKTIIAFVGNDGSGKSYQAARAYDKLRGDKTSVKLMHLDHLFLKIPKFISSNKYFSTKGEENQSITLFKVLRGNNLFGLAFPIVAYLDFLAFYLIRVIFSMEKIVILDRYFYDKLVKFYDLGVCNQKFFLLLLKLTPVPNLTIYFDLSAEEGFRRKREMTISILKQRRIIYQKIASNLHFITINAEQKKDKVFLKIMEEIKNAR